MNCNNLQVEDTKDILGQNVIKIMERGEKLDELNTR